MEPVLGTPPLPRENRIVLSPLRGWRGGGRQRTLNKVMKQENRKGFPRAFLGDGSKATTARPLGYTESGAMVDSGRGLRVAFSIQIK